MKHPSTKHATEILDTPPRDDILILVSKQKLLIQHRPLPWKKIFKETALFFKRGDPLMLGFAALFFILSLPGQTDLPDMKELNPVTLWIWGTEILVFFALSYFVFVVFVLWIEKKSAGENPINLKKIAANAGELMVPLTILSIRGAFLFAFGLILFIIPGLYWSFKYELASFCLILEGWNDESPPLMRAEQIISQYGFGLLLLPVIMVVEWSSSWIFEALIRLQGIQMTLPIKFIFTSVETSITLVLNVFMTLAILLLLKDSKPFQKASG